MGSENDEKQLDVDVDRLSSLPDDVIHKILSFNDTLDAVKTTTLSPRWRFIWTTMTCLAFSTEDFPDWLKFIRFVKNVFSRRDKQREVSSVKFRFQGTDSQMFVRRNVEYALSHNVQQLNITCFFESDLEFPLSLFNSQTLKHLILKKAYCPVLRLSLTLTSTWEVPALTTLHLDGIMLSGDNTDNFSGLISKCVNLKDLILTRCQLVGSNNIAFNIFHSELSNLTIDKVPRYVRLLSVVAPKLKNLIIRKYAYCSSGIMIFAPDLAYLRLQCYHRLHFSADNFRSLEKADISIVKPHTEDPQNIVALFQLLHSVKCLTLNLEIIEHLSSSVEVISNQLSPFANLMSLKIYPLMEDEWQLPKETVNMSTEVKNYLLDRSPGATFTMVTREDIKAKRNAMYEKERMKQRMYGLQMRLEQEITDIETNRGRIEVENVPMESHKALMDDEQNALEGNELQIEGNVTHINSCWESLDEQIKQGKKKINDIICELRHIKRLMTKLPASNRAEIQPCFSCLCAQADIVMSKIRDCMKIQYDENLSRLNVRFHELSTTLQSSSKQIVSS